MLLDTSCSLPKKCRFGAEQSDSIKYKEDKHAFIETLSIVFAINVPKACPVSIPGKALFFVVQRCGL